MLTIESIKYVSQWADAGCEIRNPLIDLLIASCVVSKYSIDDWIHSYHIDWGLVGAVMDLLW